MSIACVIPARLNSSRFPGKLLKKVFGKSVLQYTFEQASLCKDIDALFVATDSQEIADEVHGFGGQVLWTSLECQNGTERIAEAHLNEPVLQQTEFILNLQGDHPCTKPETLSAIIQALRSDKTASMATAVTKIKKLEDFLSPHIVKCVFDTSFNALYFSRSPIPYLGKNTKLNAYAHIGIYCYRTNLLQRLLGAEKTPNQKYEDLEQLGVLENGHRIKIAQVVDEILGVDTPKDLEKFKKISVALSV